MSDFKFNEQYDCLQQNYGGKSRNGQQTVNKIIKAAALQDSNGEELISVHFPKFMIVGKQQDLFIQLIRFKYLSIMQPQWCFNEDNEYVLVYQDYLKYQLKNEKFYELVQQGKGLRILLQLALGMFLIKLAFDEFEKRHYLWPLKTIEDLYYIDGLIFLSLADYDFNPQYQSCTNYQIFCNFVRQYFCCYFKEIEELLQKNSFEFIIKYLLEKEGNMHIINHFNPPYENVLMYLLQIQKFQVLYQVGNSVVKSFNTPNIYKQLFGKLKESIVYKSTKFQQEEYKQQILTNMNREIELMEKFNDQSYMAVCFTYFRIGDYSFLLQKKFYGTLADALKTWQPNSTQQQQKDVYTFSQRFANALKEMHKVNIIHRDLKPENLFLDSLDLTTSWVYIADFDRSKQLKENQTTNSQLTTLNKACTPKYDPPEENQTLQYDVFQYGLIVLTVANRGKYIGHEGGGPRMMSNEQYESYYGSQAIRNTLAEYKYKEEFLQIIISCLDRDPQYRPNANVIYDVMNKLCDNTKIINIIPLVAEIQIIKQNPNQNQPIKKEEDNLEVTVQRKNQEDSKNNSNIDLTIVESVAISPNKLIQLPNSNAQIQQQIIKDSSQQSGEEQSVNLKASTEIIAENPSNNYEDQNIELKIKKLQQLLLSHFNSENMQ